MSFGTLYCVGLVATDISENISPPSSWFLRVIGPHSCVTVESLLISLLVLSRATWYESQKTSVTPTKYLHTVDISCDGQNLI
jgi:hypothetical protein